MAYKNFLNNALMQNRFSIFEAFVKNIGHIECTMTKCYIWESFTNDFLKSKYSKVFSVHELQSSKFNLPKNDKGIDFVVKCNEGTFSAVQTKFRKNYKTITWREFSTFDSLCNRTGPWKDRILITTSKNVHIHGIKSDCDKFYGKSFFEAMSRKEWVNISQRI